MNRIHAFELEDQPWFPDRIRHFMVDYLEYIATLHPNGLKAFAKILSAAMKKTKKTHVLDLCSGSSGPLGVLLQEMESHGLSATATLTDLYPNLDAFERVKGYSRGRVNYVVRPIDATNVPPDFTGFRLMSNSFHHFKPEIAKKILRDAYQAKQPIAILEIVSRSPIAILSVFFIVFLLFFVTPFMKPFSKSRLFFTYLAPLVPIGILWDGLVSCFRVYSTKEMKDLIADMTEDYPWEVGRFPIQGMPVKGSYLVGIPLAH